MLEVLLMFGSPVGNEQMVHANGQMSASQLFKLNVEGGQCKSSEDVMTKIAP